MEEHQNEEHGYICSVCHHKCAEWGSLKDHTLQEHGGYLTSESNSGLVLVSFKIFVLTVEFFCFYGTVIFIYERRLNGILNCFSTFMQKGELNQL